MADETVVAETEEVSDWTAERQSVQLPSELPPTANKDFWGPDAHVAISDAEKLSQRAKAQVSQSHILKLEAGYFVCTSCPFTHTIPLSPTFFTLNKAGQLIPIDKAK